MSLRINLNSSSVIIDKSSRFTDEYNTPPLLGDYRYRKKSQGLSLNTIIVGLIVLVVLVVLIAIFTGSFTKFSIGATSCSSSGGVCTLATSITVAADKPCGKNAFGSKIKALGNKKCTYAEASAIPNYGNAHLALQQDPYDYTTDTNVICCSTS